jgi:hypothetical protein
MFGGSSDIQPIMMSHNISGIASFTRRLRLKAYNSTARIIHTVGLSYM